MTLRILTIHGTGAAQPSDSGEQWWQHGSAFCDRLKTLAATEDGEPEIVPFHWSGKNSESERDKAARALLNQLRALDGEGRPFAVIGHSHGGSVLHHALEMAEPRAERLASCRALIFVGTPFLIFRYVSRSRLLTVSGTILLLLSFILVQLFASGQFTLGGFSLAFVGLPPMTFVVATLFLGVPIALMLFLTGLITPLFRSIERRFVRRVFADRMMFIWDREDEPLLGLSNSVHFSIPIIPRRIVSSAVRPFAVVALIFLASFLIAPWVSAFETLLPPSWAGATTQFAGNQVTAFDAVFVLAFGAVAFATFIGADLLYRLVSDVAWPIVNKTIADPLGRWADGFILGSLRDAAWGRDEQGLKIVRAAPQPLPFDAQPPLPEEIHARIETFVSGHMMESIQTLRRLLGIMAIQNDGRLALAELSEHITWKELIHTSYFDIPVIQELIAYSILRLTGSPASGETFDELDEVAGVFEMLQQKGNPNYGLWQSMQATARRFIGANSARACR